jgi:hypothetical protein
LRKTKIKFFIRPVDILLMMRCRHSELDLTRFQAKESKATKLPVFENTRTGLTMFGIALKRAKSMEVGQSEDHLAGWDSLVARVDRPLETGFAHAMPQDIYAWVASVFETFSLEHRDAVLGNRALSEYEYPTFDVLQDLDEDVLAAQDMLKEGNRLRKQVARMVEDRMSTAAATKSSKRSRRPANDESEDSESSPSPKKPPAKKKITKVKVKKPHKKPTAPAPAPAPAPKGKKGPTEAEKEERRKAIEAWEKTPASKDAAGLSRCFLFAHDPSGCKQWICPHKTKDGVTRSHEPAGP